MRCFVVCLFPKNEEKKQENRVNGEKKVFYFLKKHIFTFNSIFGQVLLQV